MKSARVGTKKTRLKQEKKDIATAQRSKDQAYHLRLTGRKHILVPWICIFNSVVLDVIVRPFYDYIYKVYVHYSLGQWEQGAVSITFGTFYMIGEEGPVKNGEIGRATTWARG